MKGKLYYYQDLNTTLILVCITRVLTILGKTVLDIYPPSTLLLPFYGKTYTGPKIKKQVRHTLNHNSWKLSIQVQKSKGR
jgi:hypothetical protein